MKRGKTLSIAAYNWALLVKTLVVQSIMIAIVVGICMIFIQPIFNTTLAIIEQLEIGFFVDTIVSDISGGNYDSAAIATIVTDKFAQLKTILDEMPDYFNRVELSYLLLLGLLCLYRMMISSADVSVGYTLAEFMSTNAKRPFSWYFLIELRQSLSFAFFQFLIAFPLDFVVFFSMVGFYVLFLTAFGWVTIIPALVVGLILFSLRNAMLAFWLPSITVEKMTVRKALANNFSVLSKGFGRVFLKNLAVFAIMTLFLVVVNYFFLSVIAVICSAIFSLIAYYILKCINMVEYFNVQQLPYFSKKISIYGVDSKAKTAL